MFSLRQILSSDDYSVLWVHDKKLAQCTPRSTKHGNTVTIHALDDVLKGPFGHKLPVNPPVVLIDNRLFAPWTTLMDLTSDNFRPDIMRIIRMH